MLFAWIMLFFLFLPLIFANAICFHALSWFLDTVRLFCIMRSAFNLLVFHNSLFTPLFAFVVDRAMCSLEK